ncbi:hypothetical protein FOYG_02405 [Fusarium oxysporum NRRL 32931]|uniref:RING-type domain-containing protein n=1 Tax=Fusarium oxysporum NRRL 32931 TaxID=660029 RepID=W9IYJ0_FUSOX|nr:hypothetical protein FOYG_02405 [Fusarium oxysporum NRRL 32931]
MSSTTVVNMMSIKNIIHHEPQYNRPAWTTPFWPRLRDSLVEDPKLFNHLHLECGICLTGMSIFPHDHTFSPDEGLTPEKKMMSHRARILPCGHMFGNKCLHTMIDEALKDMEDGESPEIACPSCRVVFSPHSDCEHPHSGKFMPTTMEGVYAMPATLAEGGILSHRCGECLAVEIISVVAVLAPVFTPPLDLTDRETLITYGTGANLHYWAVNLEESANVYDEFVREIPLGDALQRVCDEITECLVQNSKKRWYSEDFAGLKFKLMLQRDIRPRAMEYWEAVEVLEDGEANFDLRLNLD